MTGRSAVFSHWRSYPSPSAAKAEPYGRIVCLRGALSLAIALASGASPVPSFVFRCDASESANAVYHLACLADHIPCTTDVFRRFWHITLQWTAVDQHELDSWTAVLNRVESAAPPPQATPYVGNYRSFLPDLDVRLRIIHAALASTSRSDFQRRTHQWLNSEEAATLAGAIAHFQRRLRPWWQSTGRSAVNVRRAQVEKLLRGPDMAALARQMSAFVEAESPARDIHVHVIPSPDATSDAANGTFVSNHCFVELTNAMTPDAIASVTLHEVTHYLYETAPATKHLKLMEDFVRAETPHALAFYALLNEALATAVQGLIERPGKERRSDDDTYRHAFIPRLGRSTVPVLKEALAKRSTLYEGFSQAYLRQGTRELGPAITDPRFFLTSAAILPSDRAASAYELYLREFQPVSVIKSDRWRLFANLDLVFLVAYDELPAFSTAFPDLAGYTNRRGFAYIGSRDGNATVCILAGSDAAAIVDVVRAFAKLQSVSSSGLQVSIN